jgi:hypothetical protein
MGRTACTEPQYLYSRAIPLFPLWAVRPVQSLSGCTRVTFTFNLPYTVHYDIKRKDVTWLNKFLCKFDIHGSVHRRLLSRNTNNMQLCNRIYYSKLYSKLNVFWAKHRSSSGALNCICSLWFICPYGDRPLAGLSGKWIRNLDS